MNKKTIAWFMVSIFVVSGSLHSLPAFAEEPVPIPDDSETIESPAEESVQLESLPDSEASGEENAADIVEDAIAPSAAETEHLSITGTIALHNGCEVTDTGGTVHMFPETTSKQYIAICALEQALEENLAEDIDFVDFGFGLFVQSVNGVAPENTYWKLVRNGEGASVGAAELELAAGDSISLELTAFDPATFAETPLGDSLSLAIDSLDPAFNNIILPDRCSVTDTGGTLHEFPEGETPRFLAICAFAEALQQGFINDLDFVDFGFGLFVDNVNDIAKPENSYWQFQKNGASASVGVAQATVEKGDVVSLVLTAFDPVTFAEAPVEPEQSFAVRIIALEHMTGDGDEEAPPEGENGGGDGSNDTERPAFDVDKAIAYLKNAQGADGSFGSDPLYADWAAVAYGAARVSGSPKTALLDYLRSHSRVSSLITDNERRAIALLSLDENPYSFEGSDYMTAVIDEFDGTQFGDPDLVNDDIFALIPLSHAGYDEGDSMIVRTIEFILQEQKSDGSWEHSTDVTAAAIQALAPYESLEGVADVLVRAEDYLKNKQQSDGGWGDIFSTSWALQAEAAAGATWTKDGKSGLDYLLARQASANNQGGVLPSSDTGDNVIWATSYAVPAGLGKPWDEIMHSVSKPKVKESSTQIQKKEAQSEDAEVPPLPVPEETEPSPLLLVENISLPEKTADASKDTGGSSEENTATEDTPETASFSPSLAAAAAEAVPESGTLPGMPIAIGTLSGLALLYAVVKLFGWI